VCATLAGVCFGATPTKPHKHHATTVASTHTHQQATAGSKSNSTKTSKTAHRKGKTARGPVRSYQQAPTADRYREIQQALAAKGYYKGEPNGAWSSDSSDALKRFQADQNLMPDGKINSLSLIALGLGPKRLTAKSDGVLQSPGIPQAAPTGAPPTPSSTPGSPAGPPR
jgi:hypothetical protein